MKKICWVQVPCCAGFNVSHLLYPPMNSPDTLPEFTTVSVSSQMLNSPALLAGTLCISTLQSQMPQAVALSHSVLQTSHHTLNICQSCLDAISWGHGQSLKVSLGNVKRGLAAGSISLRGSDKPSWTELQPTAPSPLGAQSSTSIKALLPPGPNPAHLPQHLQLLSNCLFSWGLVP